MLLALLDDARTRDLRLAVLQPCRRGSSPLFLFAAPMARACSLTKHNVFRICRKSTLSLPEILSGRYL